MRDGNFYLSTDKKLQSLLTDNKELTKQLQVAELKAELEKHLRKGYSIVAKV